MNNPLTTFGAKREISTLENQCEIVAAILRQRFGAMKSSGGALSDGEKQLLQSVLNKLDSVAEMTADLLIEGRSSQASKPQVKAAAQFEYFKLLCLKGGQLLTGRKAAPSTKTLKTRW